MTEIEEIPLVVEEPTENTQEEIQDNKENEEKPAAKKRGRPPGVKNRAKPPPPTAPPPAPKPKKKPVKKVEYETESEDEEPTTPHKPRRNAQISEAAGVGHLDRHQLASDVLSLPPFKEQRLRIFTYIYIYI